MIPAILVIDDEATCMEEISALLQGNKFYLLFAASGQSGLDMAQKKMPDVIILDHDMPGFDGTQTLKALRAEESTIDIPVVMAFNEDNRKNEIMSAISSGAFDYIRKPYDDLEVTARINAAVKLSKANQTIKARDRTIEYGFKYAQDLQEAILPPKEEFSNHFSDNFILHKPKDYLSGDLYWISSDGKGKVLFILCDTGPSISGAMISTMVNVMLHGIIRDEGYLDPNILLEKLHRSLRQEFNDEEIMEREGIQVSVSMYDSETSHLWFAGARSSLYLIKKGSFTELKGDRKLAGGYQKEAHRFYSSYFVELEKNDIIYLVSNGFQNQLGGQLTKRYTSSNLKDFLYVIHKKPFEKQKGILDNEIQKWMKQANEPQDDDIIVIGLRI
ncbi:MAG TPA: response regulator [Cyclobacteriaceae bacterium]